MNARRRERFRRTRNEQQYNESFALYNRCFETSIVPSNELYTISIFLLLTQWFITQINEEMKNFCALNPALDLYGNAGIYFAFALLNWIDMIIYIVGFHVVPPACLYYFITRMERG